jgi:hypothetical protein
VDQQITEAADIHSFACSPTREAAVEKFTAASSGTHPRTALDVTAATEGVLDAILHNARARGWSTKMVDDGPQSP